MPSTTEGTSFALKASKARLSTDLVVPEAHWYSGSRLVLATPPLEQPPDSVPVDRGTCRLDLAQDEVVPPSEHQSIQACHHDVFFQRPVSAPCQLADLAADAADARRAWARADICTSGVPAVVASNAVAEELERVLGHSAASGFPGIDRQFQPPHQTLDHRQHVRWRRSAEHHEVIGIIDDLRLETPGIAQHLPAQYKATHVDVGQKRGNHSPNAKGNFSFERGIQGYRSRPMVDLRRKG